jgi:hypothetical protein
LRFAAPKRRGPVEHGEAQNRDDIGENRALPVDAVKENVSEYKLFDDGRKEQGQKYEKPEIAALRKASQRILILIMNAEVQQGEINRNIAEEDEELGEYHHAAVFAEAFAELCKVRTKGLPLNPVENKEGQQACEPVEGHAVLLKESAALRGKGKQNGNQQEIEKKINREEKKVGFTRVL